MAALHGKWVKLEQQGKGPGARSSHAVTLVGDKAYAFGGEFAPRVPVDNKIYAFDLKTLTWSSPDSTGDVPPPRVGVTMAAVGTTIYVFGGRDTEHNELNELYSFDTVTNHWTLLSSGNTGPPHRNCWKNSKLFVSWAQSPAEAMSELKRELYHIHVSQTYD